MSDRAQVRVLRRELGGRLKAARLAAGFSQAQLARKTGYARSTVSTVESGGQNVARGFWQRCDEVLGTGATLAAAYDQLAHLPAEAAAPSGDSQAPGTGEQGWEMFTAAQAVSAYRELGWCAARRGSRVELVCGSGVEALEVSRAAGVLAVRWWLHTAGAPDAVRGLPSLPSPADALAVIDAGDRFLFLVQAGACPWAGPVPAAVHPPGATTGAVVRWHAAGSTILAPPSAGSHGQPVVWACPPPRRPRLADPVVLLDLLARAAALTRDERLRLPGGIDVIPVSVPPAGDTAQQFQDS